VTIKKNMKSTRQREGREYTALKWFDGLNLKTTTDGQFPDFRRKKPYYNDVPYILEHLNLEENFFFDPLYFRTRGIHFKTIMS
jgi:hypothetical protein